MIIKIVPGYPIEPEDPPIKWAQYYLHMARRAVERGYWGAAVAWLEDVEGSLRRVGYV